MFATATELSLDRPFEEQQLVDYDETDVGCNRCCLRLKRAGADEARP